MDSMTRFERVGTWETVSELFVDEAATGLGTQNSHEQDRDKHHKRQKTPLEGVEPTILRDGERWQ